MKELKDRRINVRATEKTCIRMEYVKLSLQIHYDRKFSDSEVIDYMINYFFNEYSFPTKNH